MNKVTVGEVKRYLGLDAGAVGTADDGQDALLAVFLSTAEHTVEKVLRAPITERTPEIVKTAILYCVWQYYYHRDDAEFKQSSIEATAAVMLSDIRRVAF